jgi:hypothetical protein
MPRLVVPQPRIMVATTPPAPSPIPAPKGAGDDYPNRVAKYIPGEIIAAYLSIIGFLESAGPDDLWLVRPTALVVFLICLALTPIYLARMVKPGQPKRLNMIMSTLAFLVWAYALGGWFKYIGIYKPFIGSILLVLFTLVSGTFFPREGDQ